MAKRRENFEPPPGWKYELVPEVPVAQAAVHTENETSTFQWTVTCAASSCAAVAGLVVIVIEISKNWQGLTNTATTP